MKFFGWIFLLVKLTVLVVTIEGSLHTWGEKDHGYGLDVISLETKLVDYVSTTPKDFRIVYQYIPNYVDRPSYIGINVNGESDGSIRHSTIRQWYKFYEEFKEVPVITAIIHPHNTYNFQANLTIYKKLTYSLELGPSNNKSFKFLYMRDAHSSVKPYVQTSIGQRQSGDQLLHFESKIVRNYTKFPLRVFSYDGTESNEYLTCSRTAMALVNQSYVGDQEFNSVVYDMNSERFAANFSVYGIKSMSRPNGFLRIL
ncbi:hypothetical protein Bhyg_08934 [Pseudolycoriella hygida]|uniref:Uncharacterized protein n=1 Tax=Pseudolycoriella hygida TaxID=35572 RepID=A0A9Q0N5L3_9DIPT|nr:hypothetical protein Bhyg_08934 [Pseudolycoriella hygida]